MKAPWQLLLLVTFLPPTLAATPTRPGGRRTPPTRRPGEEDRREEGGRRGRIQSSTPAPTTKVIDFSLDVDQAPDSNGSYTGATLEKEDLPPSFTICMAYMVEAWTTQFTALRMFAMWEVGGGRWFSVYLFAAQTDSTEYHVDVFTTYRVYTTPTAFFPLQWTRACLSLDTDSAMVRLVVDGQMLGQEEYKVEEDEDRPANLSVVLGISTRKDEFTGQLSSLNISLS